MGWEQGIELAAVLAALLAVLRASRGLDPSGSAGPYDVIPHEQLARVIRRLRRGVLYLAAAFGVLIFGARGELLALGAQAPMIAVADAAPVAEAPVAADTPVAAAAAAPAALTEPVPATPRFVVSLSDSHTLLVRSVPGGLVRATLTVGDAVEAIGPAADLGGERWMHVRASGKQVQGWVKASFLRATEPTA